jgi:DnaJ-class molecular chaperone
MDYYQTLGVAENADQETIKQAYKKLAMKNHPDRGGDTQKFQSISQAYDTLSDPQKRQQYDAERNGQHIHVNMGGPNPFGGNPFGDIFNQFHFQFGPGFANHQQMRRNRDLTIRVSVSFKQSYTGTQLEAKFNTTVGHTQTVAVDIPAGVENGQTIRYPDLGDDAIPGMPRGNLNVQVMVEPDPVWSRRGNDLVTVVDLTLLEAMAGCTKNINNLDGTVVPLTIKPGVTHGTEYSSGGRGFRNLQHGFVGNLIISVNIVIPVLTNPVLKSEFETLYAKIIQTS